MFRSQTTIRNRNRLKKTGIRTRFARTRRFGTATVEMAIVSPFIFLIVFGSIEFARMMMVRQALTNAAREGCRHACLVTTQQSTYAAPVVRERLRGVIANSSETDALRIAVEPSFTTSPAAGTRITASVEIDCSDVSWLPPFFTGQAKIRGTSSMNRE